MFTSRPQTPRRHRLRLPRFTQRQRGRQSWGHLQRMNPYPAPQSPLCSPTPSPPQPWPLPIPHWLPPGGWPRGCDEATALGSCSGPGPAMDFLFLGRWRRQEGRVGQGRVTPSPGQQPLGEFTQCPPGQPLSLQRREGEGPSKKSAGRGSGLGPCPCVA